VLVDAKPADARLQRARRNAERLRRAVGSVHPAAASLQRPFDLLALIPGIVTAGANGLRTEARKLEVREAEDVT